MKHAVGRSRAACAKRGRASACLLVLSAAMLYAGSPTAAVAQPITSDSRIKTFVYNPNEVFSITTHYGYQSNIEFALKESIETISVGDRVGWQVVPAGRRLFIRAMEENARTNMTVVTNMRAYQFELRSSSATAVFGSEALTYVVRFFYPADAAANGANPAIPAGVLNGSASAANNAPFPLTTPAATTSRDLPPPTPMPMATPVAATPIPTPAAASTPLAQQQPSLAPALVPPAAAVSSSALPPVALTPPPPPPVKQDTTSIKPLQPAAPKAASAVPAPAGINYRYTFSGPDAIAPTKIFDDGKSTYFKLPASDPSTLEVVTSRGTSFDVPTRRTRDGLVAVDMVAQNFRLKQAGSEVLIYNEASSGVN